MTQNPSTRVKVGKTLPQVTLTWMMILTMTLRMMTKKMGKSFSKSFYLPSTNPVLNPPEPRSATPRFTMAATKRSYAPSSYNACLTSETAPKLSLQAQQKFNMPSLTSPVLHSNTSNQRSLAKLLPSLYGLQLPQQTQNELRSFRQRHPSQD